MGPSSKIGVREIAARVGVSFSTVAAALRDSARVKADTRRRIQEAAKEMGYARDVAASILAKRRQPAREQFTIAYLGFRTDGRDLRRIDAISEAATARGMRVRRVMVDTVAKLARVERELYASGVDGLVLGRLPLEALQRFSFDRFCVVSDDPAMLLHGFDVVRADHFEGVMRLLGEVRRHGYLRMGVMVRTHEPVHPDDMARHGAVLTYSLYCRGDAEVVTKVMPMDYYEDWLSARRVAEMRTWLRRERPDVVVGFNPADRLMLAKAGAARVPFAVMITVAEQHGVVAGLEYDQPVILEPLLDRLETKMRLRMRGRSGSPLQAVVRLPFLPGASLPSVA